MERKNITYIKISLIYLLMFFGGLWNMLGYFKSVMEMLAVPFLTTITFIIIYETIKDISNPKRIIIFLVLVYIFTFVIEFIGIKSGKIFGTYKYGPVLNPFFIGVPLVIGFAWINVLLSSFALTMRLLFETKPWQSALFISAFMVLFDAPIELASGKLGYWEWINNEIPLQNFTAWFLIGYIISYIGIKKGGLVVKPSPIVFHAYFAQIIYFLLSAFR